MQPSRFIPLLLVIGALVPLAVAFAQVSEPVKNDTAVRSWEHLALAHDGVAFTAALSQQINRLGADGWELVSVTPTTRNGTTEKIIFAFKRPKR